MCLRLVPAGPCRLGILEDERRAVEAEARSILPPQASAWAEYLQMDFPRIIKIIDHAFLISVCQVTVGNFNGFVKETGYLTEGEQNGLGSVGLDLESGIPTYRQVHDWRGINSLPNWLIEKPGSPSGFTQSNRHPVVCVSWNDAANFCNWLSATDGIPRSEWCFRPKRSATFKIEMVAEEGYQNRKGYRLPTEDEWEYACRAGTVSRYNNGQDTNESLRLIANVPDASLLDAWSIQGMAQPPWAMPWRDGFSFTSPVGCFQCNQLGLFDMHGNVGEWCERNFDTNEEYSLIYPSETPPGTPLWPTYSDNRKDFYPVRGGVWLDPPYGLRSGDRGTHLRHPVVSAADIGFRIVKTV